MIRLMIRLIRLMIAHKIWREWPRHQKQPAPERDTWIIYRQQLLLLSILIGARPPQNVYVLQESDLLAKLSPWNVFLEFLSFSENPGLCRYSEEEGEIEYGNGPENQCQKSSTKASTPLQWEKKLKIYLYKKDPLPRKHLDSSSLFWFVLIRCLLDTV